MTDRERLDHYMHRAKKAVVGAATESYHLQVAILLAIGDMLDKQAHPPAAQLTADDLYAMTHRTTKA